jgi:DNA-binding response OmpR family regulator
MTDYGPLNVLIVEDEAILAMDLEGIVEDAGHKVAGWAMNAAEARRMISSLDIDVAFVDIHLGDGPSGVDLAEEIRRSSASPVVFLTANPKRIPDHFAGAIGVISKPFTVAGLQRSLGYLAEGMRRPPPESERPHVLQLSPDYETAWA